MTEDFLSRHFRVPRDSATAQVRMALRSRLASPHNATVVARYCRLWFKRVPQAKLWILDITHF